MALKAVLTQTSIQNTNNSPVSNYSILDYTHCLDKGWLLIHCVLTLLITRVSPQSPDANDEWIFLNPQSHAHQRFNCDRKYVGFFFYLFIEDPFLFGRPCLFCGLVPWLISIYSTFSRSQSVSHSLAAADFVRLTSLVSTAAPVR